ncbi:inositol-pentakisphosphate 2-kinase [Aspergillus candidus]|uniref:Inositol-pentakisphosphate 2-kinase n=1 Tax=Aspergillus candidus TaxID=41067 RepID=A0A2I2F523_ASPCN|nr:inositol-pentakisphosphate 2-kinase [Aspergillus candidus]PLB35733.1 inositol-pentakisphosphate 2-kinase [Aspergillus candidus]
MTKSNSLELPVGARLVYLAEGGANIIYRIVAPLANGTYGPKNGISGRGHVAGAFESHAVPKELRGKLLRLRKDTPSGVPYQEISRNFDRNIRPLFKSEELVDQELIRLPLGLVSWCNEQLRLAEVNGRRPKRRHGVYLSLNEPFGLLVTDMTPFGDPRTVLAEFKPKWLLQSPTAPGNARRCRTCALRELKNHDDRRRGGQDEPSFCPLDLISDKFENVLRATRFIKGCKDQRRLARILHRNHTLHRLVAHQVAMGDVGLHGPAAHSRDKSLAMTLRDCTMFIKMSRDEDGPVEVRLGDLDLKTGAGGKAKYWQDLERQLIGDGWYMGHHSGMHASECALQGPRGCPQPSI